MKPVLITSVIFIFGACGPKPTHKERYIQALNYKLDGDAEAYYDALIALANEAKSTLKTLFVALQSYLAETGRYCTTFQECGFQPKPNSRYLYFLSDREVRGGGGAEDLELLHIRAIMVLDQLHIKPMIRRHGFLIVAVGNIDSDEDLDVWTIDHENNLLNPLNDLE